MDACNGQLSVFVGLGEVLWDLLPDGRQVGGAPANFAYHAQALGMGGTLVSSVGNDDMGRQLLGELARAGVDTRHVQVSAERATGTVSVEIDSQGKPRYIIHEQVAWDAIEWSDSLSALAERADCVCVGSLAQRSPMSRKAIQQFLASARPQCLRIFDVNLRQAYYDSAVIDETLRHCNVLKLNDEEWPIMAELLEISPSMPAGMEALRERYGLRMIALTRGAKGSLLLCDAGFVRQAGQPVRVVNSVGAGDAFTAALAVGMVREQPIGEVLALASRLAAYTCTQPGAMPPIMPSIMDQQ